MPAEDASGMASLRSKSALMDDSNEGWTVDVAGIERGATELVRLAEEACSDVESRLKFLADRNGGRMVGLEFKIKQHASLARKMKSLWTGPAMSLDEIIEAQYDVLRFTMILPKENYSMGCQKVLDELVQHQGCTIETVKNYWGSMTYRGINSILRSPNGCKFELQFHTDQSFDQKQNKTHLVYEALRTENNAMKQNLLYLDMVALYDAIDTPERVEDVGTPRVNPEPALSDVTEVEKAAVQRILKVKHTVRCTLQPYVSSLRKIEPRVSALVDYACACFDASLKNRDHKVRGSLNAQRKVEEDLRRELKKNELQNLHHITFPDDVDERIARLVEAQSDLLLFSIVIDDESRYAAATTGMIEMLVANGFTPLHTDNHWSCDEKHHPIEAAFEVSPSHPVRRAQPYPVKFTVEFHTKKSWEASLLRSAVKSQIEGSMYQKGLTYKKSYVDSSLRFDPGLGEHWMTVEVPEGADAIGSPVDYDPSMARPECLQHSRPWKTPSMRATEKEQLRTTLLSVGLGVAIGAAAALAMARGLQSR